VVDECNCSEDILGVEVFEASADLNLMSAPDQRNSNPGMRLDLITRVRREIEAGTYETPEKWDAALDRLAETLGRS